MSCGMRGEEFNPENAAERREEQRDERARAKAEIDRLARGGPNAARIATLLLQSL
jgi:hypothetical protein